MKIIKTAVAGLGRIGWQYHLPVIMNHEGFELTAVTDPLRERLDEAVVKFGVKGYTSYDELLALEDIDLMVIASPTPFHSQQAIACFEQGIDVFMEKPMACSVDEADRLISCMKTHHRKMMVYQPHRVTSEHVAVGNLIEQGNIGSIYMIKRASSAYTRRNDWQSLRQNDGGMLNNYGAHYIDQMLNLAGSKAKSIACSMRKIASRGDADDVVKAVIETENDIILDLDINMATAFTLPSWYIMGSLGTIVFEEHPDGKSLFRIKYLEGHEISGLSVNSDLAAAGRRYDNLDKLVWHEEAVAISDYKSIDFYDKCYDYFALGKESFVPVSETREVIRVMEECRKAARWDK